MRLMDDYGDGPGSVNDVLLNQYKGDVRRQMRQNGLLKSGGAGGWAVGGPVAYVLVVPDLARAEGGYGTYKRWIWGTTRGPTAREGDGMYRGNGSGSGGGGALAHKSIAATVLTVAVVGAATPQRWSAVCASSTTC